MEKPMPKKKRKYPTITGEQARALSLQYASGKLGGCSPCPDWKYRRATELRQNPTMAERCIAKPLRKMGFDQSVVLYGYIADFYHKQTKLVVEIDGPYHASRRGLDRARDAHLAKRGIRTIRLTNEQASVYLQGNLKKIADALLELRPTTQG
jgi:very-short-patch-repair endonuclease